MSGYGDNRRGQGRDHDRERSPIRSRNGYERRRSPRGQSQGGQSYGTRGSSMEYSNLTDRSSLNEANTPSSQTTVENLPDIPADFPVPATGQSLKLVKRHDVGKRGRAVNLRVNHFAIQSLPIVKTYQYNVIFSIPPSSQRRGIEKVSAMQQAKAFIKAQNLFGTDFVFDSISLGWSATMLLPIAEVRSTVIDLDNHSLERPNQVQIEIRNCGTLNIMKLVHYLRSGQCGTIAHKDPAIEDCFKWMNAVFKKDPSERFLSKPRSTAYFHRVPELTHKLQSTAGILEAVRGMHQAVTVCFGQLSINVDVLTCAFYVPGLCMIDVARALSGVPPGQSLQQTHHTQNFADACSRMVGMFVVVRHLDKAKNDHKMRVQRLNSQGARLTTFEEKNHQTGQSAMTSVLDYFKRKYSIALRYPDLPLLITKDGMFPMEVLFTAPGERYKEPLQGAETKDFIEFATSPAYVRAEQVMSNVKRLNWHTLETPKTMGLSVISKMIELKGRVLDCPTPVYKSGTEREPPISGSWNLRRKTLLSAAQISSWGLLYLSGSRRPLDDRALEALKEALSSSLTALGLRIPNTFPHLIGNPQGDMKEILSNIYGKTGSLFNRKPNLFFILLHDGANPLIYKLIKSVCEVDQGVASQVMIAEKATSSRGQVQYLANVGLKVNLKLGGANTSVGMPLVGGLPIMILGADSSHPSPAELRRMPPPPSYSALVASYDPACVRYTAVATAQPATNELISTFKPMVIELLKRFYTKNRLYPQSIIFFRDGIAESQISSFMQSEVKALREACLELVQEKVKISVINCIKRHHTRFFPCRREEGDKLGNVLPGTCVEASPNQDFFLVSQSALQGCVRPTRYCMLDDDNGISADDFQNLANGLCFSYGRATRSVKVVSPVYYADQVCERARMHIRTATGSDTTQSYLMDAHNDLTYTMYWQ